MPGLVDAHIHSAAVMARGWAQEVATWMASAYGPSRATSATRAPLATMLALMEGVANGTTTFGDYDAPHERDRAVATFSWAIAPSSARASAS